MTSSFRPSPFPPFFAVRGFTLVELTIVIVLMGILMGAGLKMFTSTLENAAYSETRTKQERLKLALVGYLRTNGYLPCPDSRGGIAEGNAVTPCVGAAGGYGVIPWRDLGLPRESVVDGWGNYFSYRVANGAASKSGVTSKNWTLKGSSKSDFTIKELTISTDAITIEDRNPAGTSTITSRAVVVIISHGKNGSGAKTTKVAARIATDGAGQDEITNATVGTSVFVLRPVVEDINAPGGAYDDLVLYLTPQDLLQPLISEGTLKACQAYCLTSICSNPAITCECDTDGAPTDGPCKDVGGFCSPCMSQPATNCKPTSTITIGATPDNC